MRGRVWLINHGVGGGVADDSREGEGVGVYPLSCCMSSSWGV